MNNLKSALRGYDSLAASNNLRLINDIKRNLTTSLISEMKGKASKIIFGKAVANAELVSRQYLLHLFADLDLNKKLLCAIANPEEKVVLNLPSVWLDIISSHGIKIDFAKSRTTWNAFLRRLFWTRALLLIRTIFDNLLKILGIRKSSIGTDLGDYAYMFSLSKNTLPQPDSAGISHDFISWYINWNGGNRQVKTIYHNVQESASILWMGLKVAYLERLIQPLQTRTSKAMFVLWCIKALIASFKHLLTNRWWNTLLLEEGIQAAHIRFQQSEALAKEYYFNNSGWIYRPLWTYEAENKGSSVHFYFYSTNCESFASSTGKADFHYGYQTMNWPHYLVWDKYQEDFVRNATGNDSKVSVVGPIWFATSARELEAFPEKTIAVFDVQPVRDAFYKTLGISFEYYVPRVCNQFLSDILEVSKSLNHTMALKRKRDIGRNVHPAYRNFIKKIEESDNFASIDSSISAIKVIENSSLVISMPFTSTAILGRELNKPSVFYDPLNMVQKDDHAAHGIQIISGIEELYAWVNANV